MHDKLHRLWSQQGRQAVNGEEVPRSASRIDGVLGAGLRTALFLHRCVLITLPGLEGFHPMEHACRIPRTAALPQTLALQSEQRTTN
jgi:hypothetical protein